MARIKWTNKFSREEGFVGSIDNPNKHFVNASTYDEAKVYKTEATAKRAIKTLTEYGEADNNDFEVIE